MKKSKTTIKKEVVLSDIETQAGAVKKEEEKEKISALNKTIMMAPKVILVIMTIFGLLMIFFYFWIGVGVLTTTVIFLYFCLRNIPHRPPYIGVVVIWGKRLPIVKKEGWRILASSPPFMYTVTMIKVEKTNIDLTFSDIRCKARTTKDQAEKKETPFAGGEISVNISYTYYPDYNVSESGRRLISFINSGGHEGIQGIVRDLIEEDIRQMARDHSWEEITFAGDEIKNRLVKKLTGEELKDEEKIAELGKNGFPDIIGLGIRICRFNIGKVKEQGELAKAAEKFAKEVQERRGENEEMEFVCEWVERLKKMGVSPDVALDTLQVERNKAKKDIKAFRGFETAAKAFGEGLSSILKKP